MQNFLQVVENGKTFQGEFFFLWTDYFNNLVFSSQTKVFIPCRDCDSQVEIHELYLFSLAVNWCHRHLGKFLCLGSFTDSATIAPGLSGVKHRHTALAQSLKLLLLLLSLSDIWWRQVQCVLAHSINQDF